MGREGEKRATFARAKGPQGPKVANQLPGKKAPGVFLDLLRGVDLQLHEAHELLAVVVLEEHQLAPKLHPRERIAPRKALTDWREQGRERAGLRDGKGGKEGHSGMSTHCYAGRRQP